MARPTEVLNSCRDSRNATQNDKRKQNHERDVERIGRLDQCAGHIVRCWRYHQQERQQREHTSKKGCPAPERHDHAGDHNSIGGSGVLTPLMLAGYMLTALPENILAVVFFRRYGLLAAIVLRLGEYLIWHIIHGNFVYRVAFPY